MLEAGWEKGEGGYLTAGLVRQQSLGGNRRKACHMLLLNLSMSIKHTYVTKDFLWQKKLTNTKLERKTVFPVVEIPNRG